MKIKHIACWHPLVAKHLDETLKHYDAHYTRNGDVFTLENDESIENVVNTIAGELNIMIPDNVFTTETIFVDTIRFRQR